MKVFCGKTGIRTPETLLAFTRFPGVPLQPLEHLSLRFRKQRFLIDLKTTKSILSHLFKQGKIRNRLQNYTKKIILPNFFALFLHFLQFWAENYHSLLAIVNFHTRAIKNIRRKVWTKCQELRYWFKTHKYADKFAFFAQIICTIDFFVVILPPIWEFLNSESLNLLFLSPIYICDLITILCNILCKN